MLTSCRWWADGRDPVPGAGAARAAVRLADAAQLHRRAVLRRVPLRLRGAVPDAAERARVRGLPGAEHRAARAARLPAGVGHGPGAAHRSRPGAPALAAAAAVGEGDALPARREPDGRPGRLFQRLLAEAARGRRGQRAAYRAAAAAAGAGDGAGRPG